MSRYPAAKRLDLVEELHGQRIADPYRWLEDPDDPATKQWLLEQDELLTAARDGLPGRAAVRARVTELLGAGAVGTPVWRGDRRFFIRRDPGQEHAVLYTVDGGSTTERVLIDPMALDPTAATTLDAWQPDKEGRRLAYQISSGGNEESVLHVLDVATGEHVDGPIDRCRYTSVAWLPGGEEFCYVRRLAPDQVPEDERQYHRRVYRHRVGTPTETDVLLFGEGRDKTYYYSTSVSRDGRWLVISASRGTDPRNDLWIANLPDSTASTDGTLHLVAIQEGVDAQAGAVVGRDGRLYIHTDNGAPRGRLVVTDPTRPGPQNWHDLLPEDDEAVLQDFEVLDGPELDRPVLLASWSRHAIAEVSVHNLADGDRIGEVPLPGLGSLGRLVARPDGGHEAWFGYTDDTTAPGVRHFDARTMTTTEWAAAPGAVQVPDIEARQVTYASADGTRVRMRVIGKPGHDGPRPTILYGYGGFGIPMTPGYSATALAWAEAGGVYAIANLRGGDEEGEQWHRAGMLDHKQRVFDDLHAAAEHLISGGVTTADRLAISGGSNGGLLVGAALTQRPDLYAAVVCSAPLLDMVRYERFGLGALWTGEYGSADDPEALRTLLSYSPYHNVTDGTRYPATLFEVFDGDSRVDLMHAYKMCAALQHATAADAPILLRRETHVGHGARAVSRSVDLVVDTLAFIAAHTGLRLPEA